MKEKQKDMKVTSSPSGQQKQNSQSNSKKSFTQPKDSSVKAAGEKTSSEQELKELEHPHEVKTPLGFKANKEQNRGQSESVSSEPSKSSSSSSSQSTPGKSSSNSSGKKN